MRITVDIDAEQLVQIRKATGLSKHSPAIRRVVEDYLHDVDRKHFLQKVMEGRSDYALTNDELEKRANYDPH